ncbi:MAG TPA: TA system VapC family ribonuclease toxin [Silvibacterium sp.]|nr:TA system VapC family ribonuclease toxin [Silvibacterium sp.]
MSSLLFPDVNVWVALNLDGHAHHAAAKQWYEALPASRTLVFCRKTQLGLFRILTTVAVMGQQVLSRQGCWQLYDRWIATGQVAWADEPLGLEELLRSLTGGTTASQKAWMDAYLTAFAEAGNLTLVTLDKALAAKVKGAVLLG